MDVKLSHCFVVVDDQDQALAFYRDAVGLEVRTDATMGDTRWLTVGPPAQPEIEIGLMTMSQYPARRPPTPKPPGHCWPRACCRA